jgi:hypothetical protein
MSELTWEEHYPRFIASGLTIKEYSEQNNLNPNTARKHFNSKKNKAAEAMITADDEKDHSGDHHSENRKKIPSKRVKNTLNESDKQPKLTKDDKSEKVVSFRSLPKKRSLSNEHKNLENKGIAIFESGSSKGISGEKIRLNPEKSRRKKTAPPTKQKMISNSGGGIAILPGIKAARTLLASGPESHLQQVIEMAQATALEYMDIVRSEADDLRDEIDGLAPGVEIEGVHPSIKLRSIMEDAAYFMNDFTTRLASIYQGEQKLRQNAEKQRLAERQQAVKEAETRERLSLMHKQLELRDKEIEYRMSAELRTGRIIAAAIRMRECGDIDDIGVAEYIERRGVEVPITLAMLARRAIEALEPPTSDIDVDEEQLERDAQEYARHQKEHPQWLANRRAEVNQIVDTLGYGDIDATGERKAGEFDSDTSDLELDPTATSDIYGDYETPDSGYDEEDEIEIPPPEDE